MDEDNKIYMSRKFNWTKAFIQKASTPPQPGGHGGKGKAKAVVFNWPSASKNIFPNGRHLSGPQICIKNGSNNLRLSIWTKLD